MKLFHESNNEFAKFSYEFMRPGSFGLGFYFHTMEEKHGDNSYLYVCEGEGNLLPAEEENKAWEGVAAEVFKAAGFDPLPLGMGTHAVCFKFISNIVVGNGLDKKWFLDLCRSELKASGIIYDDMVILFDADDIKILERR